MKLRLEARVSSDSPDAVGRLLVAKLGATSVTRDGSDWIVCAEVESASARDANRELLSELRRVEPNGARFAVPCRRRVTVHYVSLYAATGRRAFASAPMLE